MNVWSRPKAIDSIPRASRSASIGSGSRQLWQDEHATWWAASLSLDDLRRLVADVDVAQALYYLLMHSWIEAFGDSEAS